MDEYWRMLKQFKSIKHPSQKLIVANKRIQMAVNKLFDDAKNVYRDHLIETGLIQLRQLPSRELNHFPVNEAKPEADDDEHFPISSLLQLNFEEALEEKMPKLFCLPPEYFDNQVARQQCHG